MVWFISVAKNVIDANVGKGCERWERAVEDGKKMGVFISIGKSAP